MQALGEVYRGPFSSNFWSSRGCLYKHTYPVRCGAVRSGLNTSRSITCACSNVLSVGLVQLLLGCWGPRTLAPGHVVSRQGVCVCFHVLAAARLHRQQGGIRACVGHAHICWRGWTHLHSERHNSSALVTQPAAIAHHVPRACMHSQQPGSERRDSFVQVSQRGGPRSFSGPNPTRPWTDVCLAFRTGQRISGQQGTAAGAPADLSTLTAACKHMTLRAPPASKQPSCILLMLPTAAVVAVAVFMCEGPLYFGFSDVHVQRALAAMYTPAELAHALHGTPLTAAAPQASCIQQPQQQQQLGIAAATVTGGGLRLHADSGSSDSCDSSQHLQASRQQEQALSVAEAYAAELQAIQGIGAATAKVLALTTALGGARHDSLQALCSWLASDPGYPEQLQHYLLHRCARAADV